MLTLGHSTKLFMCRKPVDFRFGFDGLANLCKKLAGKDPYSGSVFLFFNRAMTKAKLIYFDGTGSVMIWKRLEAGKYKLPKALDNGEFSAWVASRTFEQLAGMANQDLIDNPKKSWFSSLSI